MNDHEIILYTQPGWHFCGLEKAWLSNEGIEFSERNIAEDPSALEELQELNVFSTPVTLIDGELVVGFDKKKIMDLLGMGEG